MGLCGEWVWESRILADRVVCLSCICRELGLVVSPAARELSPPMCVPTSSVSYCGWLPDSCDGSGLEGISDGPSGENRPMMHRRPMACFAPRRLYAAFELMAPLCGSRYMCWLPFDWVGIS